MSTEKSPHYYFQHLDFTRISLARELRGLTKKELAERIGKTPSAITQYENGKSGLSFDTFMDIVQGLNILPGFLSRKCQPVPTSSFGSCHFRANARVTQSDRQQAYTYALQVAAIYEYLEDRGIRFPPLNVPIVEENISEHQIETLVVSIRKAMGLGLGPILDMAQLIEGIGIRIIMLPVTGKKLDAFANCFSGHPYIMLDSDAPASRMQFNIAHEYAHHILDAESVPSNPLVERRANRFASAFLMPAATFSNDCPRQYRRALFGSVKQTWHVSIAAALYRARELGILSEQAYKSAQIIRARTGLKTHEEGEFTPPLPSLLERAMSLMIGSVTLDVMAEDLGIHLHELRSILTLQNVSEKTLDALTPAPRRATVIPFNVYKS